LQAAGGRRSVPVKLAAQPPDGLRPTAQDLDLVHRTQGALPPDLQPGVQARAQHRRLREAERGGGVADQRSGCPPMTAGSAVDTS